MKKYTLSRRGLTVEIGEDKIAEIMVDIMPFDMQKVMVATVALADTGKATLNGYTFKLINKDSRK